MSTPEWKKTRSPAPAGPAKPQPPTPPPANQGSVVNPFTEPQPSRDSALPTEPADRRPPINPFNSPQVALTQNVPNGIWPQQQPPLAPFPGDRRSQSQPNRADLRPPRESSAPTGPRLTPTIADDDYLAPGNTAKSLAFSSDAPMQQPNYPTPARRSSRPPSTESQRLSSHPVAELGSFPPPDKRARVPEGTSPVQNHGTPPSPNFDSQSHGFHSEPNGGTGRKSVASTISDNGPLPPLRSPPPQPKALFPDSSEWDAWQSLSVGWRALRRDLSGVLLLYAGVVVVPLLLGVGVLLLQAQKASSVATAALFLTMILVTAVLGAGTTRQSLALAQNKVCRLRRMLPGLRESLSVLAYLVLSLVVVGVAIGCLWGGIAGLKVIPESTQQITLYALYLVVILLLAFLWVKSWFVVPSIMHRRMGLLSAIRQSVSLTEGLSPQLFAVMLGFMLMLLISGSLMISIFVFVPILSIAKAHMYLTLLRHSPDEIN